MTAPGFLLVDRHVALNPVAQAVMRARLDRTVAVFATRLYLLQPDEKVPADGMAAARVLFVATLVLDAHGASDSAASRVMRGAISTIEQLARRQWRWRPEFAAAIDVGLQHAQDTVRQYGPRAVQAAWLRLAEIDARLDALAAEPSP